MGYEFSYAMEEALTSGIVSGLVSGIPSFALSIVIYVLKALALYTIAKRRGIHNPWLAWIPVVDLWIIGSISDQYRYVVKGEYKSKRKTLLVMNIFCAVLYVLMLVFLILLLVAVFSELALSGDFYDEMPMHLIKPLIGMSCAAMLYLGMVLATTIVRYVAMYDVYTSLDPANGTLYLVLSILFSITEPFFLFCNRNRDDGMPPRREEPVYMPPAEPCEADCGDL